MEPPEILALMVWDDRYVKCRQFAAGGISRKGMPSFVHGFSPSCVEKSAGQVDAEWDGWGEE